MSIATAKSARVLVGIGILAVAGFYYFWDTSRYTVATIERSSTYSALTEEDKARLSAQREIVLEEARRRYATTEFFEDERDLALLQRLLDDRAFSKSQTYELQSLGVVFGDVFAARPDFEWTIVQDEYGRDPTLRYRSSEAHLNALTMISKRIEDGQAVNVAELFAESLALLEQLPISSN